MGLGARQLSCRVLEVVAMLAAMALPAMGLQVRGYDPGRHDRFLSFPSGATATNPGFLHAAFDLTGVGWTTNNTKRQLTMVSPRHVVGAYHFRPNPGNVFRCVGADGVIRSYLIAAVEPILNSEGEPTDLFLGTLTADVPPGDGVSFVPYLNLPTEEAYSGSALMVLGKPARGGRATLGAFSDFGGSAPIGAGGAVNRTRVYAFSYSTVAGGADDAYVETGDSGSPSLVAAGGTAAIVGVHTAVATVTVPGGAVHTAFDTFVPHYVPQLNELMADEGYHMTAVTPAATTLGVGQEVSAPILRAGYPFDLVVNLSNQGGSDANNLKLRVDCPGEALVEGASGPQWIASPESVGRIEARRGGVGSGEASSFVVTMTLPSPGAVTSEVEVVADEAPAESHSFNLVITESYLSWSAALEDEGFESDPDRDGLSNILEYAFGGDPAESSRTVPGTAVPLAPRIRMIGPDRLGFRYLERRDAAERGLGYHVEYSDDLSPGGWLAAGPLASEISRAAVTSGLDLVEVEVDRGSGARFLRMRISLDEGP